MLTRRDFLSWTTVNEQFKHQTETSSFRLREQVRGTENDWLRSVCHADSESVLRNTRTWFVRSVLIDRPSRVIDRHWSMLFWRWGENFSAHEHVRPERRSPIDSELKTGRDGGVSIRAGQLTEKRHLIQLNSLIELNCIQLIVIREILPVNSLEAPLRTTRRNIYFYQYLYIIYIIFWRTNFIDRLKSAVEWSLMDTAKTWVESDFSYMSIDFVFQDQKRSRLHLSIVNCCKVALVSDAWCCRNKKPLWLNTLFTGAEVAGLHHIFNASFDRNGYCAACLTSSIESPSSSSKYWHISFFTGSKGSDLVFLTPFLSMFTNKAWRLGTPGLAVFILVWVCGDGGGGLIMRISFIGFTGFLSAYSSRKHCCMTRCCILSTNSCWSWSESKELDVHYKRNRPSRNGAIK